MTQANAHLFHKDFKPEPYWWQTVAPATLPEVDLPKHVDVVVVGSGYTGLHAAIQIARGGKHVLVVDAEQAGWGCSTRNGGQISTSLKYGYNELAKRYGDRIARAIMTDGRESLHWTQKFVEDENIDCNFANVGRFHAAHNTAQFKKLKQGLEEQHPDFANEAYVVDREDQRKELGTDAYFGGIVLPQHCSLNPAKYHRGLVDLALKAGVKIVTHCAVNDIMSNANGHTVDTAKGPIACEKVVVATNGYTSKLTPWQQRRVIPIGSYVITTEEIAPDVMKEIMPSQRIISDSRKVVFYYRPSPDHKRIIFGGRVSHSETNPVISGPRLHRELINLFPALESIKISYSWMGFVAYTFDTLMHVGEKNGLHYAMGYCGSGVGMASYLGMKMGKQVLGEEDSQTGFNQIPFPTRPLYTGKPWFLTPSVFYYRIRDRINI